MSHPTAAELRDRLIAELRRDLVGPHTPEEVLSDRPTVQYLTGILYPAGQSTDDSEEDERLGVGGDDADDEGETQVSFAQTMYPAAIGLSFAVERSVTHLTAHVRYGLYRRADGVDKRWQREQIALSVPFTLAKSDVHDLPSGARLEWTVRPRADLTIVTLSLVNRNPSVPEQPPDDAQCLFQPQLRVSADAGQRPFRHRVPAGAVPNDPDLEMYRLLYRDSYEFAVGHSCAVTWGEVVADQCGWLQTASIPDYALPMTTPNALPGLEMAALADAKAATEVIARLQPLLEAYAANLP